MANLYLMCGVPGAGKSTFIKKRTRLDHAIVVSRDAIRFSIVKPDEEYFSHEDEVVKIFWEQINKALAEDKDVFVDQTSLTPRSRKWLLQHATGYKHASVIWIDEDLETCLKRNEERRGTRSYVPESSIRRMYDQFVEPSLDEGFTYIFRYNSKENQLTYKGGIIKNE